MDWTFVLMDSVREMLTRVGGFIPKLVGLLIILVVGWIIAKVVEAIAVRVLKLIRVDTLSEKAGVSSFLAKGGVKYTLAELIGVLVYWILILIAIVTALNAMQWTVAAELLDSVIKYIPKIVVSLFVLVFGMLVATLLSTTVRTAASNAGITKSKLLGQITQSIVIVFAALIALQELQIETAIIVNIINIVVAATGLAAGLAFGLGCKDIAGKFIEDLIDQLKKK